METIHADGDPLSAYLEGEGSFEAELGHDTLSQVQQAENGSDIPTSFAPLNAMPKQARLLDRLQPIQTTQKTPKQSSFQTLHHAWSSAVNSRIGRADNAKFLEHFRYIIVASQLLDEYLDQGVTSHPPALQPDGLDGATEHVISPTTFYGAAATAFFAFTVVYTINWARGSRTGKISKSRVALVLTGLLVVAIVGYAYIRRQWLKYLRQQAVSSVSALTTNWQAHEVSATSALSFIQEVELVSKGYRLSTPLPPASRIEGLGTARRCGRLRKRLWHAYANIIPACISACEMLGSLIDGDDLERYFEIYDISSQDAKEASGSDALSPLDDDRESLKSLRVLSYRCNVLRRVLFCSLMALEADGGKSDFWRWRFATNEMINVSQVAATHAEWVRGALNEMEHISIPKTPIKSGPQHGPGRERIRTQVRKISALSSGIRGLQAKMQILREESSRSIEQTDDLTDLGPNLMAQYESIGTDLRELMQAWETGKASLASNITKQERRISLASSGLRSPVSSLGGLTAVEEDGTPDDALRALNGGDGSKSNRSSLATTPSNDDEEMVFEAVAMPRQRSKLTREERISKMYEERERQATIRAKRESSTNMMRELESVINLRPRKAGASRITSI